MDPKEVWIELPKVQQITFVLGKLGLFLIILIYSYIFEIYTLKLHSVDDMSSQAIAHYIILAIAATGVIVYLPFSVHMSIDETQRKLRLRLRVLRRISEKEVSFDQIKYVMAQEYTKKYTQGFNIFLMTVKGKRLRIDRWKADPLSKSNQRRMVERLEEYAEQFGCSTLPIAVGHHHRFFKHKGVFKFVKLRRGFELFIVIAFAAMIGVLMQYSSELRAHCIMCYLALLIWFVVISD